MSTPTDQTGTIPDVSKLAKNIDRLQSESAALKAENAQLKADVDAAREEALQALAARDEAQARAEKLSVAVDAGVSVEREAGDIRTGDVVIYRLKDVVTGDVLEGPGFVTEARDGGLTVSPLSPLPLTLTHEHVQLVPTGTEA